MAVWGDKAVDPATQEKIDIPEGAWVCPPKSHKKIAQLIAEGWVPDERKGV